ncbi:MAG: hypothetical protein ISS88_02210 [Candidatus Portnoybacteria bacterium]|nr:hypothetical protein [Candidatus Portnoybacteria bacterium]
MEQDLIKKIKQLKKIQPSQEWLDSTRLELASMAAPSSQELSLNPFNWFRGFHLQPVALGICLLLIFTVGPWLTLKASQASLPGDVLYSVKRASEGIQTTVASDESKAQLQVEFAGRRIEELTKITGDSLTSEEKSERVKEVVDNLRDNLAEASVYAARASKEKAMVMAKKTKSIKEELDKNREEVSLEVQNELAEAGKVIEEINHQVLTVLVKDSRRNTEGTVISPADEEILIFLEELESGVITTTEEIINKIKE